ncbi:MAG TPA: 2-dehydropantoate 2-reductase N-terminal domain-containing protein, partial [Anaerolineales bacterium]
MQASTGSPLKILTFGAGAIGTYIGGSLAIAGHSLVFLERASGVDELRKRGLRLDLSADSRRHALDAFVIPSSAFAAVSSLEDALRHGPFDAALFALKSFDTAAALEEIKPLAGRMPPVLCMSNGVDNEPALASVLGADKVIYGALTTPVGRRAKGDIVLDKLRGVGIGEGHPLSRPLAAAFEAAYLNPRLYRDALSMKWSKLLINLIANPTSAILDMTAAEVFANKNLFELEIRILRECLAVMTAQDLKVVDLPGIPVRALVLASRLPLWLSKPLLSGTAAGGRGGKMPSLHIDL